ncbi:MAG: cell division protein SepF [Actinomycetota bacterium]
MLKKTLIYLGLGPDEEYDAFDEYAPTDAAPERPATAAAPAAAAPAAPRPVRAVADPTPVPQSATVRPIAAVARPEPSGSVRIVPAETRPESAPAAARTPEPAPNLEVQPAVRIVDSRPASPHAISPETFNDAQSIGDRFKAGQAVIVNLQHADRDLRRRLVDFASGLCYALGGKMDRVADQVYLLTPTDVEVSAADTRRALD